MTEDEHVAIYKKAVMDFTLKLNRTVDEALFSGKVPEHKLPWPAVLGEKCPHCHGYGHDDGGPGSWWCKECNGTGIFGARFGERPIILP